MCELSQPGVHWNDGPVPEKRVRQHELTVEKKESNKSALARHAVNRDHQFDFENPSILVKSQQDWKRMYLEELYMCTVYIKNSKNCVNIKSREAIKISAIYSKIIDLLKPNHQFG